MNTFLTFLACSTMLYILGLIIGLIFNPLGVKVYFKEIFISWVIFSFIFTFAFSLFSTLGTSWSIALLLSPFFLVCIKSFDYIIQPHIFYYFRKIKKTTDFDKIMKESNIRAKIVIIDDLKNAFATGLGLFGLKSIIILGSDLTSNMNEQQIKGIVLHEIAHLKFRHLYVSLLLDVIGFYVLFAAAYVVHIYDTNNMFLFISVIGALGGMMSFLQIPMRRYELKADKYAASIVGADVYISALEKLNEIVDGKMEKFYCCPIKLFDFNKLGA